MFYYDDEELFEYDANNNLAVLLSEECSAKEVTDILMVAGLVTESGAGITCSMEKLVYFYGDASEVYSSSEIRFVENVKEVYVFPEFIKVLNRGNMVCRVIVSRLEGSGQDALKTCVSFEKIVNKAMSGFNIFMFILDKGVYFGCRVFEKNKGTDCTLSKPIVTEEELEQILDELFFFSGEEEFMHYYNQMCNLIMSGQEDDEDYEELIRRKKGIQLSYLDTIDMLGEEIGIDVSREKERYWNMFESKREASFAMLLDEVEEELAFIKSNKVNTYELLFEAEEQMRFAQEAEEKDALLAAKVNSDSYIEHAEFDAEVEALLDNPEEMIKLLKQRRGL